MVTYIKEVVSQSLGLGHPVYVNWLKRNIYERFNRAISRYVLINVLRKELGAMGPSSDGVRTRATLTPQVSRPSSGGKTSWWLMPSVCVDPSFHYQIFTPSARKRPGAHLPVSEVLLPEAPHLYLSKPAQGRAKRAKKGAKRGTG